MGNKLSHLKKSLTVLKRESLTALKWGSKGGFAPLKKLNRNLKSAYYITKTWSRVTIVIKSSRKNHSQYTKPNASKSTHLVPLRTANEMYSYGNFYCK